MMISRKAPPTVPAAAVDTPYRRRLCSVAAAGDLDRATEGAIAAMIQCVDLDAYGRLRTFYRGLALPHRQQLGAPPASRALDTVDRLEW
jgi:hypothetical protein